MKKSMMDSPGIVGGIVMAIICVLLQILYWGNFFSQSNEMLGWVLGFMMIPLLLVTFDLGMRGNPAPSNEIISKIVLAGLFTLLIYYFIGTIIGWIYGMLSQPRSQ